MIFPLLPVLIGFYIPIVMVAIEDQVFSPEPETSIVAAADLLVVLSTIRVVAMAALLATLIGLVDAILLAGTRGPLRGFILILLLASFLIPPAALASAVQACVGASTLRATVRDEIGAVLMLSLRWAPVAAAILLAAVSMWPRAQERALRSLPPGVALIARLRGLRPAAFRCAGLLLLLLLPAAELPSYAGVETVSQRILARLTVGDAAEGWRLAMVMVTLLVPAIYFLTSSGVEPARAGHLNEVHGLPRLPWANRFLFLRVLPAVALILVLFYTAWPRASEVAIAGEELVDAVSSIGLELPRALLASVVAILCGWRLADGGHRIGLLLLCLPTMLPGSLGAIAVARIYRPFLPLWLDDLPFLLTITQLCKLGALAAASGFVATCVLPASERVAAHLLSPTVARWRIRLPRALPVLIPAIGIGVALVLGEVEATLLLAPPGHPSTALELHQMMHFRNDEQAARLALVLAMLGATLALLVGRCWKRGD